MQLLGLDTPEPELAGWQRMVERAVAAKRTVNIGLVGKYTGLPDAYLSVVEAIRHGGLANDVRAEIRWIPAEDVDGLFGVPIWTVWTASWFPGDSASGASRARYERSRMPAPTGCPSWASVWASRPP